MSATTDEVVRYRMERAKQNLADVEMLAQTLSWSSRINRLYYACFYAISALMERDGVTAKKHYVRTARMEHGIGDFYTRFLICD